MKTEAQKQFDADYIITRHLLICNNINGGVVGIKNWIKTMGNIAVEDSAKEIRSERYRKLLGSPSAYERDEMKWIKDHQDE